MTVTTGDYTDSAAALAIENFGSTTVEAIVDAADVLAGGAANIDWSAVGDVSTGDDSAELDEAVAIDGLANTGTTSYSISDAPNKLGAADLTDDEIAAIENASGTVTCQRQRLR